MRLYKWLAAALILLVLGGCGGIIPQDEVMATITPESGEGDPVVLTKQEFLERFGQYSAGGATPQQAFEIIVGQKIGLEMARQQNISVPNEEVEQFIDEIEQGSGADLSTPEGLNTFAQQNGLKDEQDLRRVLVEILTLQKVAPPQVHARHILFGEGVDPQKPEAEQEEAFSSNKQQADQAYTELQSGADFEELATEHSTDPGSGQQGGDLGFIGLGQTVKPFEEQLFALEEGEVSQPVKTQFGWHIIQRLESRPADRQSSFGWAMQLYQNAQEDGRIEVKIPPEEAAKEAPTPEAATPEAAPEE